MTAWGAMGVNAAAAKRPQANPGAQARKSGPASTQASSQKKAAVSARSATAGKANKTAAGTGSRRVSTAARRRVPSRRRTVQTKEPQFQPYVIQNWPEAALAAMPSVWTAEIPPAPPLADNCRVCETWLLAAAYQQIGIRYRLGGTRPETGFDCSGLMKYLYETNFSVTLPPTAPQQFQFGLRVEQWELEPGDLVFFRTRRGWHVGMYVGNDAFIHAPNRRKTVRVSPLFSDPYWRRAFTGARRVPLPEPSEGLTATDDLASINNN